jgi:high-affinity Fe2+/Pb2+ permease
MAHIRSEHRDDFDVELRRPSAGPAIAWSIVASVLGVAIATALAMLLSHFGVALK